MATQVATGKPKVGGALYRAPIGTALPTDASTTLNTAFKSLGYISADGMTNSNSSTSNQIKEWGGAVVAESVSEKVDSFTVTLIEAANLEVLKTVYGDDNVTGALTTGITIKSNMADTGYSEFVFEMVHGGIAHRLVIPKGKVSSVGDIAYKSDTAVAYPITITAMQDTDGNTHYSYMKE